MTRRARARTAPPPPPLARGERALSTLGIDPGRDGGASLLDPDGRLVEVWGWRWLERDVPVWRLRSRTLETEHAHLHGVGEAIAGLCPERLALVVEGLFGHGVTLERLSWFAALVAGPLLDRAVGEVRRPEASTWRPTVLGIAPSTPAKAASAAALRLVPRLVPGLGRLATDEHACEATAIARWGHVTADPRRVRV